MKRHPKQSLLALPLLQFDSRIPWAPYMLGQWRKPFKALQFSINTTGTTPVFVTCLTASTCAFFPSNANIYLRLRLDCTSEDGAGYVFRQYTHFLISLQLNVVTDIWYTAARCAHTWICSVSPTSEEYKNSNSLLLFAQSYSTHCAVWTQDAFQSSRKKFFY